MPGRILRVIPVLLVTVTVPAPAQQRIDTHSLALAEALPTYRGGDLRAARHRLVPGPFECHLCQQCDRDAHANRWRGSAPVRPGLRASRYVGRPC